MIKLFKLEILYKNGFHFVTENWTGKGRPYGNGQYFFYLSDSRLAVVMADVSFIREYIPVPLTETIPSDLSVLLPSSQPVTDDKNKSI